VILTEIVATDDLLGGAPRIEGVHHVAHRVLDAGEAPERVAADDDIEIADVDRALVYYDYADEIRPIQAERQSVPDGLTVVRGPDDLDPTPPTVWRP